MYAILGIRFGEELWGDDFQWNMTDSWLKVQSGELLFWRVGKKGGEEPNVVALNSKGVRAS